MIAAIFHPFRWLRFFVNAMLGNIPHGVDPYSYDEEMDPDWDGDWDESYAAGEMDI